MSPIGTKRPIIGFTLRQIEADLEAPSAELHAMAMEIVARAIRDESILRRLAIPERGWGAIRASYHRRDPSLYGRLRSRL